MNLIVTGGGTAGHVYPALYIADYFVKKDALTKVLYIGRKGGIEEKIVKAYGYDLKTINVRGFRRKLTLENLKRGFMAFSSILKCMRIIKKFKADIVIGTGGYVAGPVCLAAELVGVKTAIHEQNVFAGVTNRLLSKRADFIFCGFKETADKFPGKNTIITGNPVFIKNTQYDASLVRSELGIPPEDKFVLSVGGSGGSPSLNTAIAQLAYIMEDSKFTLMHSTGENYYEDFEKDITGLKNCKVKYYPYIHNIEKYIAACDIAISSSGASSIAQLNFFKKPIIAVPKANTAENHQEFNARTIEKNGAGICITEKELSGEKLLKSINEMISDETRLRQMSENSYKLYNSDSLEIIYNTVIGGLNV